MTTLIRGRHPYVYRSGTWAVLRGIISLPGFPEGNRLCWIVEFSDGEDDWWPVNDRLAGYEFLMA